MFGAPWRSRQWTLKSPTLSVSCGAWWRPLPLPLRSHHPKRPLATRMVTYIYNSSQHRLNGVGLEPEQRKRRLRNGLRDFNGAIPATTDKGELSLPPATTAATTRSVTQTLRPTSLRKNGYGAASTAASPTRSRQPHLSGAVPDAALLLLVHSEFVCWHAFLTSRRIDC